MTSGRRYTEQEVAAIFERAAQAQQEAHEKMGPTQGLTLEELQQIGAEAGITPEFIAQAAAALGSAPAKTEALPAQTFVGFPISVARTVELPRALTDDEWYRLVADARDTFDAHGQIEQDGALRQWRNGNLKIMAEPTGSGQRLRMRTLKGMAREVIIAGLAGIMMLLVALPEIAFSGDFETGASLAAILGTLLLAALVGAGWTNRWLRDWRATRAGQMEALAARAVELTSPPVGEQLAPTAGLPEAAPSRIDFDAVDEAPTPEANRLRRTRA